MKVHLAAFRSTNNPIWAAASGGSKRTYCVTNFKESFDFSSLAKPITQKKSKHIENLNILLIHFRVYYLKTKELWRAFVTYFILLLSPRAFHRAPLPTAFHARPRQNASSLPLSGTLSHVIIIYVSVCFSHWIIDLWEQDLALPE